MLEILYQDQQIVVCLKPAGVLSQDAGENSMPCLLREQLGVSDVYVVHRLDREAAGMMVFALTQRAAAELSKAIQENQLKKQYLAILRGVPAQKEALLEDFLFHDKVKNKTYVVKRERKGVKKASLEYTVLNEDLKNTLVKVWLHTGRTHQIRVQFSSRGLPLEGDGKYGGKAPGVNLALWCYGLSFPHPATKARLSFEHNPPDNELWSRYL